MSDTHNKLQYGNNYNHWKILDLVLDLNYFSCSNPNPNPTHLSKHPTLSPNHQLSQRILYVGHSSVRVHVVWSQKFCLTPETSEVIYLQQVISDSALLPAPRV